MDWQIRAGRLRFAGRPLFMGIVNVTPDSFSDGGRFLDPRAALEQAHEMVAGGADLIDVGGESTRPGAAPVTERAELERVIPVVAKIAQSCGKPVSIDTTKAAVAREALAAGASVVNDISGLQCDPGMCEVCA